MKLQSENALRIRVNKIAKLINWQIKAINWLFFLILMFYTFTSCTKLVEIDPPRDSITTSETFSNDQAANSAFAGIYSRMINTQNTPTFSSGAITLYSGLSSDELAFSSTNLLSFYTNSLLPDIPILINNLWAPAYFSIYKANACLEGLEASTGVSAGLKKQLTGEAKFIRAFHYFYLVNLFGPVPLVLSSDWKNAALLGRSEVEKVYNQITLDLQEAQTLLSADFSYSGGERTRPTKWAAKALLARVYLYIKDWTNAEMQATDLLSNTDFAIEQDLNNVFLNTSLEAIWQLKPSNVRSPFAIPEARNIIPTNSNSRADFYLPAQMRSNFESDDKRVANWIKTSRNSGITYYYPYKYKVRIGVSGGNITEYYTILRLTEQYLIRAEARTHLNKLGEAISDLNIVRQRAGVSDIMLPLTQLDLLLSIEKERLVELFSEWGHRWFDLKRTNRADLILSSIKGGFWQTTDQLYPIPLTEINRSSFLTQNPGY